MASSSSSSSSRSRVSDDDTVYVAVGIDYEENKLNLLWAIENIPGKSFCILYVHQPSKLIPLVGGKFPANRLDQHELKELKEVERKIIRKIMDDYLLLFYQVEVHAEKICTEMDDIGKGIVELIYQYDVKKLVMGAAANKHYTEEMIDLKSMKAKYVQHRAPHSCQIYYTCSGYHIYTWEGDSTCSSTNGFRDPAFVMQQSNEGNSVELELCEVNQSEEDGDNLDASDGSNIDLLYGQLERAFLEAEKFKQEAYEESRRRGEAEKQANKALYRAQALQNLYAKELRCRKETEEALAKEKEEHQKTKNEREQERLITMDQKLMWGIQASGSNSKIEELKDERLSAVEQCEEYKKERDKLLEERDNVLRLAQEISDQMLKEEEGSCSNTHSSLVAFSFAEIEDATCSFDPLLRIGEIRHGKIYKGVLHHTPVAIKVLNRHSTLGFEAFRYEVDMMSKLRHPNIAILIGACEKECTLIYEYLANGNLEDRLKCKDNTPPLPWQTRINIATEICLVLTFLHSFTPHGIVHGDLTSTNILLDSNFSCKLSGFRTCRSPSHGDIVLDPHFLALATGEVSPKLDTYSFGIILLQLLTGLSSINGQMEIIDAIDEGSPSSLSLDTKAGDWPAVQAEQLIHLAFRCCSSDLTIRPDLESDVWRALEAMRASSSETDEFGSRDDEQAPSYFVCPILQEVMEDPHVAADGYTYEAEALRGWLASGHNTSPMTNLELQHLNLIPNYSLRSAIIEWKERQ